MKKNDLYINIIFFTVLTLFSISINFYYGNIGVFPIDTFAFFDSGYRLNNGDVPFKDYWTISGPFIDILQSFYFFNRRRKMLDELFNTRPIILGMWGQTGMTPGMDSGGA